MDRDDDPFDDFFKELERMMNDMMGPGGDANVAGGPGAGAPSTPPGADVHVDVHETDDEIRVIADVPGVEKESIDLKCDGTVLTLQAESGDREYHERLTLPTRVDEHSASASYNNGVLEVTFDRRSDASDISVD